MYCGKCAGEPKLDLVRLLEMDIFKYDPLEIHSYFLKKKNE